MAVNIQSTAPRSVSFIEPVSFLTTVSTILPMISGILRGLGLKMGTVHLNSTQANQVAAPFADKIYAAVVEKTTMEQRKLIGKNFARSMVSYLGSLNRWANQSSWAPVSVPIGQINGSLQAAPDDPSKTLRDTLFYYGVWILRNMDAQRPDEFVTWTTPDLTATLVKAYEAVTGKSAVGIVTPPASDTPEGTTAGSSGFSASTALLVLGGAGLAFYYFSKKR